MNLPEERIENWREHHKCSNMKIVNENGQCIFCKMNEEALKANYGYEYIPFDVPGAYNKNDEPHVKIQKTKIQ